MDNEYLVQEFLDGTLNTADEEKFFSMLSAESDLRSELKQHLAIKSAIKSDVRAYTPKAASTLHIFDKLGLAAPVLLPLAAPGFGDKILSFVKINSGYILTGLASAAATALVFLLMFDLGGTSNNEKLSDNNSVNSVSGKNAIHGAISTDSYNLQNTFPSQESKGKVATDNENPPQNIVYKYIYVKTGSSDDEQNSSKAIIDEPNDVDNFSQPEKINFAQIQVNPNNDIMNFQNNHGFSDRVSILPNLFSGMNIGDSKFAGELRGSEYLSGIAPDAVPSENMSVVNAGVAFFYKINDNLKIGIDYRRERFPQEFSGFEGDKYYQYQQQPNFQTWSLAAKYNPEFLQRELFSPFAMISFGGNSSGPVGRIMAGTDLYLFGNYYLNLGLDYNLLLYTQSDAAFFSSKAGFHIGAGFNF